MLMEDFENQLINLFNSCPLSIEAKRYVVHKFGVEVEASYKKTLQEFLNKQKKEAEKTETEEVSE